MARKKELTLEERIEQALVPEEEWPYELPDGWKWVRLTSVYNNATHSKKKIKKAEYMPDGDIAIVDQGQDIIGGFTNDSTLKYDGELPIIIFGDHTRCVKFIDHDFAQGADGVKVLVPVLVDAKFFYYGLQNLQIKDLGYRRHFPLFKDYVFPVPTRDTQIQIVKIIEEQFEKLDRAKVLIQNAFDSFEDRKAAILHKAFTGELTKKWREENEIVELDTLIEKEIDLNTLTDHRVILDERYNLPDTWRYCYLENVVEKLKYGTSSKSELSGDYPVLRMGNIQNGYIDWLDLKYTSDKEEYNKFKLNTGDLVFNRTNSPELVGKTAIYNGEMEALFAGYLIKIEAKRNIVLPEYLNYFMNSGLAKDYCYEVKTDGVSQSNINAKKLGKFPIPICSINEQKVVIDLCDRLISSSEEYMRLVDMIGQIDQIKKSILSKAFRGVLVK